MKPDPFEELLQRVAHPASLQDPTAGWKAEILSTVMRSSVPLKHRLRLSHFFVAALITAWIGIAFFSLTSQKTNYQAINHSHRVSQPSQDSRPDQAASSQTLIALRNQIEFFDRP